MQLDCRTALILRHPNNNEVLLLKRAPFKKIFPNLITGIGGKVEFSLGEDQDLEKSLLREFQEETKIDLNIVEGIQLRLASMITRGDLQVILLWFTGQLTEIPPDLSCNEGDLAFYPVDSLPLKAMTPTAAEAVPFILSVTDDKVHNGVFRDDGKLITTYED